MDPKQTQDAQPKDEEYVAPRISDYGDLAELTALGRTGGRADANFRVGDPVTFLST